jgi:hypothetical protein
MEMTPERWKRYSEIERLDWLREINPVMSWSCDNRGDEDKRGYLGLIVSVYEDRGYVRREGYSGKVEFQTDSAKWHTFRVAFDAGHRGATREEWKQGSLNWNLKRAKERVSKKLRVLGVQLERDVPPTLIPI